MKDERGEDAGGVKAVAIAAVLFCVLSTVAGVTSKGFLEADACTHYQYARFVWQEPYRLIDVWGRPVGVAFAPDGSLFFSEDGSGTIWRVSRK